MRADAWAARLPAGRWQQLTVREGTKAPLIVGAVTRVMTRQEGESTHRSGW